jgi:formylglycine-generating enzyme required for sulfatase activity
VLRPLFLLFSVVLAHAQTRDLTIQSINAFRKSSKVALIVGVGTYPEESGLASLKFPLNDASALADVLEQQGYMVQRLTDTKATRPIVRKVLNDLAQVITPEEGSFLFYFAGHGFAQDGVNYLATYGVATDNLKEEGLAVSEVERLLKRTKAKRQMMFIDACRNEPSKGSRTADARSFATLKAAEGMRALYATKSGAVSYEAEELGHGLFTHFLIQGLKGEAANPKDGLVTFRDLSDFVVSKVKAYSVKAGKIQVPFEAGESTGDFLMGEVLKEAPVAEAAPPEPKVVAKQDAPPPLIRIGKDGLRHVFVPPGEFQMGCSDEDKDCEANEKPKLLVKIPKGFLIGQIETPVQAYRRFANATGRGMPDRVPFLASINPHFRNGRLPMIGVTQADAAAYCKWAGGRLPKEEEWEYAARAGTTNTRYGELDNIAWTAENSGTKRLEVKGALLRDLAKKLQENQNYPHTSALKAANAFGLFDMIGNVAEWTAGGSGTSAMVRGGSWADPSNKARVSVRGATNLNAKLPSVGFRCVVD